MNMNRVDLNISKTKITRPSRALGRLWFLFSKIYKLITGGGTGLGKQCMECFIRIWTEKFFIERKKFLEKPVKK